jgi:hypothetical protein
MIRLEAARLEAGDPEPRLIFHAPLPWLLYLDFAVDCAKVAAQKRGSARASLRGRPDGTREPTPTKQVIVLDALAEEAASVLFSYAAIEAFANQGLWWKGADYRYEVTKRGIIRLLSPEDVGRQESLRHKLRRHLPTVMERPQPPGGLYREFIRLERLRHGITHSKLSDRWGGDAPTEEKVMGRLFRGTVCGPRVAGGLIGHFLALAVPAEIQRKVEALPPGSPD